MNLGYKINYFNDTNISTFTKIDNKKIYYKEYYLYQNDKYIGILCMQNYLQSPLKNIIIIDNKEYTYELTEDKLGFSNMEIFIT